MRKASLFITALLIFTLAFTACGKKSEAPVAGSASPTDMLNLVPQDANGVFFVNVNKAMGTEFARKAIEKDDSYQKYQEFITKTGIDPQKDIYYAAIAMMGELAEDKAKGAAILNMKFDKEKLIALAKEKAAEEEKEIGEEDYNGITLYHWQEQKDPFYLTFLDDSNIVAGNEAPVKAVIDVVQKRQENLFKNPALADLVEKSNKDAMVWGNILIAKDALDKMKSSNPMLSDLEGISAVSMFFDYKNQNMLAEIKLMNSDADKNKKIAEMLTGFKALGSMAAGEKPEIGELMSKIEVSSGADHVKIFASLPEDLIAKLSEKKEEQEEE